MIHLYNMDKHFREIYYKPGNMWTGNKAIKMLTKLTSFNVKNVKDWLGKQALWQIHLPAPRNIQRPHYNIEVPNQLHQFDVMYMPTG